jgi:pimeloyl-ACP methyl ester carboxylesterase
MTDLDSGFTSRNVQAAGVTLRCVTAGASSGPMVLLLHGFPAHWSTWREPMRALAAAGFHAVAPDLRGYGESDKPAGIEPYSITHLVDDVEAIVRAFGRSQVFVAGHDFGGGLAWATAMFRPELVARLATLNSVHPVGFERQMRKWSQIAKSWYVFLFQLPLLPEWLLGRKDFDFVKRGLRDDGLSPEAVEDLLLGIRPPGALRASIDWYRASFRDGIKKRVVPRKVDVPVLSIWGDRERHLDAELATPPADWVTQARVEHVPEGSHWVHHDAPAKVAEMLIEHFRK